MIGASERFINNASSNVGILPANCCSHLLRLSRAMTPSWDGAVLVWI